MNMKSRVLVGGLIVVLLAALPAAAWAGSTPARPSVMTQAAGEVTYGTPVEGSVDNQTPSQDWTLTAQGADRIAVRVEREDGNLVPDVTLLDSNNEAVGQSYGSNNTYAVAEIDNLTLPAAGTYTVQVARDGGDSGTTTGKYTLTVTALGVAQDHPNNTTVVGPITYDTPVQSEVTGTHWWNVYTFDGEEGDYVQLTEQRLSDTLSPEVWLLDNNGQTLTQGYVDYTGARAQSSGFELPYTGQYQVVAQRTGGIGGETVGQFQLTVSLLGSGENSQRLAGATPGLIQQYDAPLAGQITNAQWYQDWQFRTVAGDTVTITVQRSPAYTADAPNTLRPEVLLLDNNGQEITRGYVDNTGATAALERYDMPGAGTYTVRVSRDGDKTGQTTGGYTLTVTLIGSGEDNPNLTQSAGTVAAGMPVTGEINALNWEQVWDFSGKQGDVIDIMVARTDSTLVPYLEVWDSNQQPLTSGYASDSRDGATIRGYSLPYDGNYSIVVSRDGGQHGYTAGHYTLTVAPSAP
ncbi:MAG: hypothetical protein HXY24_11470 [Rubrivivax sp.]|nr:hypothetical protein [Rubrivivax sp.]